jgi:leader peptidase (prepilin peptidase)/N-methyltransferase
MSAVAATPADARLRRPPTRELLPTGGLAALVAVVACALAVGSLARFGLAGRGVVGVVLCPTLALLAAVDARHRLLPNEIVLAGVLLVGLALAALDPGTLPGHLAAGLEIGGVLLVLALASRGALGLGDVKLGFLIGLALGGRAPAAMGATALAICAFALALVTVHGASVRGRTMALGPFLAFGAVLAFFLT